MRCKVNSLDSSQRSNGVRKFDLIRTIVLSYLLKEATVLENVI